MKKLFLILSVAVALLPASVISLSAKPGEEAFRRRTVVYKGENMLNVNFLYTSLISNNSELFLLVNNATASGAFFRTAPSYSYAYADNLAAGARFIYCHANADLQNLHFSIPGEKLDIDVKNARAKVNSYGATLFHRWYIGLDRKGNIGVILEADLDYLYSKVDYATGGAPFCKVANSVALSFAPGIILYIIPAVSIQTTMSIFDVNYKKTRGFNNGEYTGSRDGWNAGVRLNILYLNFGITYHF